MDKDFATTNFKKLEELKKVTEKVKKTRYKQNGTINTEKENLKRNEKEGIPWTFSS